MTAHRAVAVRRTNPRFSATGRYSTSVVTDDHGRFALEGWALGPSGPRRRFAVPVAEPERTIGLPSEDGRTALVEHRSGASTLTVLNGDGRRDRAPDDLEWCQLLPAPAGSALAVGLRRTGSGSRILLVHPDDGVTELAGIEAPLVTGWPFGPSRMLLGAADGSAYLLDLRSGLLERLPDELAPAGTVLLGVGTERFVLAQQWNSSWRLLLGSLSEPLRPLSLPAEAGRASPVAIGPDGRQLALVVERGAANQLMLLDHDGAFTIANAGASMLPAAAWTADGLWGIGSTPDRPPGYYWLAPAGTAPQWCPPAEDGPAARLESFAGADGAKLEAVVYGPDWRAAEHVVLALHGGPRDHWRLAFDPSLRILAGSGVCVIALNQRGSTGYGLEFELAIKGCWGGPDLADIRAVAAGLRNRRPAGSRPPALWGTSYGAFLALLAAAAEPDAWAGCVAISPFASAERLYGGASTRVRALIERLDARRPIEDDLGSRDLVRLGARIRCPVLIAHGGLDERIPVDQARAIVSAIDAAEVRYLELADRGHAVLLPHPDDAVLRAAIALVGSGAPVARTDDVLSCSNPSLSERG